MQRVACAAQSPPQALGIGYFLHMGVLCKVHRRRQSAASGASSRPTTCSCAPTTQGLIVVSLGSSAGNWHRLVWRSV